MLYTVEYAIRKGWLSRAKICSTKNRKKTLKCNRMLVNIFQSAWDSKAYYIYYLNILLCNNKCLSNCVL